MQHSKQPISSTTKNSHRIALVGPNFFSYIQAIRDEFIARGFSCTYYDERHSNSIGAKIAYRLHLDTFIKRHRDRHLSEVLKKIIADGTTDVYLIDIEVVNTDFVKALRAQGISVHLYMWDSANNKDSFLQLLPLLNGRSSFEPEDCERYGLTYIPLFAETVFSAASVKDQIRKNDLVFLGTVHSHRAVHLFGLEQAALKNGFKINKLLYYHSKILFAIKCLLHPVAFKYIRHLRTKGFSKSEIADAYFASRAVLDIHHPGQAGLTSRTFESLRSGAWLITLNKTVLSLPEELHERIILLNDVNELSSRLKEVCRDLPPISREMDYFLSLERFTTDLLTVGSLPQQQL